MGIVSENFWAGLSQLHPTCQEEHFVGKIQTLSCSRGIGKFLEKKCLHAERMIFVRSMH